MIPSAQNHRRSTIESLMYTLSLALVQKVGPVICEDEVCELSEFYRLDERWSEIFRKPMPVIMWTGVKRSEKNEGYYIDTHLYHAGLRDVLDPWKASLDVADQRAEAEHKGEQKRVKEETASKEREAREGPEDQLLWE